MFDPKPLSRNPKAKPGTVEAGDAKPEPETRNPKPCTIADRLCMHAFAISMHGFHAECWTIMARMVVTFINASEMLSCARVMG